MKIKNKKKFILILVSILLIIITIIIILCNTSFATGGSTPVGKCITTSLGDDNSKELEIIGYSQLPDEEGINEYPVSYEIVNNCDYEANYSIKFEINRLTNINYENLRFAHNNEIYEYNNLSKVETTRGLYVYTLKENQVVNPNQTINLDFRIWETITNDFLSSTERTISVKLIVEEE